MQVLCARSHAKQQSRQGSRVEQDWARGWLCEITVLVHCAAKGAMPMQLCEGHGGLGFQPHSAISGSIIAKELWVGGCVLPGAIKLRRWGALRGRLIEGMEKSKEGTGKNSATLARRRGHERGGVSYEANRMG